NHMHRLMMTSATYRRSSETTDRQRRLDPNNRLLSHMPLRRMEAEVLRDSLLAVAGQLDLTPFGPPDDIDVRDDGLVVALAKASGQRRSIYIEKRRSQRLTILDNFDRPAMSPNCVDRTESIVAPQALQLMNNKTVYELSLALADRILLERGEEDHDRIDQLFLVTVGRAPIDDERHTLLEVLERIREKWLRHEVSSPQVEKRVELERKSTRRAYQTICHAVLSSAAFLYID
ncbi:MAG: DUF1553 domain-containing protein, partial [Pirellulaceae bacterium]|nr:DUF1553 domain-containing protein [Pirellulaceae bacterium]